MAGRPLSNNQVAAVLAFVAGLVFLAVEWNGTRIEGELVLLIADLIPGPNPALTALARFLAFISPLSAALVIAGAILFLYDRVRLGKIVILFGTGVGIISLVLFIAILVRKSTILVHEGVIPELIGVVLSLAARMKAKVQAAQSR